MIDWIVEMGISVTTVEDNGPKMAAVTAMDEIVTDYEEENGFQKGLTYSDMSEEPNEKYIEQSY